MKLAVSWLFVALLSFVGCQYSPGPDKQGGGMIQGAATGATTGAMTGIQVGTATGPAAFVGAGVGAVAGAFQGAMADAIEEEQAILGERIKEERDLARAHSLLAEHYERRLELHPTRDIYPADYFFYGDQIKLKRSAVSLVDEIARMNKERLPWSRLIVTTYSRAKPTKDKEAPSEYAYYLAEERSKAIVNRLVRNGLEPRRIEARAMIVDAPILIDPKDDPARYNQAIEITPLDR